MLKHWVPEVDLSACTLLEEIRLPEFWHRFSSCVEVLGGLLSTITSTRMRRIEILFTGGAGHADVEGVLAWEAWEVVEGVLVGLASTCENALEVLVTFHGGDLS